MTQVPTITLNDGVVIPQYGFGVWQVSTDDIVPAVSKALEVGYRHIDTAAMYGNEEGVGKAIATSGIPRDEIFVTTKLNNNGHLDAVAKAEESVRKLGLDHVDLYLIHWPLPKRDTYLTAWRGLEEAKAKGLTRSIGVCNFEPAHLQRLADEGLTTPSVNQIEVHPTFTNDAAVAASIQAGVEVEAWSPLGSGVDLDNEVVGGLAKELGKTAAQVILRWHLQLGYITFPKSVTPSRIQENFEVFDFQLNDDQVKAISALDDGNRTGPNPNEFDMVPD
ncbi:MAG: aldo/keto reductase [Propionibacteriaceae bacterium]